jgi:hypothetical protein
MARIINGVFMFTFGTGSESGGRYLKNWANV